MHKDKVVEGADMQCIAASAALSEWSDEVEQVVPHEEVLILLDGRGNK